MSTGFILESNGRIILRLDEVERMMREAESHAEDDKKRREEIETRNRADQAVYGAETMLTDMGEKLSADDKTAVQAAVDELKVAVSGNDVAAMSKAMDQLTQVQHKAAEALYKQGGSASSGSGGDVAPGGGADAGAPGGGGGQGEVIDAEVVDDDKK